MLVATDNHVGYNERDPVRGDDSWRSFHEVMCLAKERDVDMVLLAGDLFHENKPSRKSMYQVMRSLRANCLGDKPCELELLSDASENFQGAFDHVNYEDLDINVAIPVFSIHGNHDDPSGEGHLAALDILQVSGLINYYGRTPESDNIQIKPVLLQKGRTKLALYGMSNVRDERLFRTFRDGKVKFYQPSTQKGDWFNLMSVHQNHHAYTETGYLPENFLPEFLDLVVWGHEHECIIDPRLNPETSFKVMQPGSSVATSLVPGESVAKHVAILTIKGRDFTSENVRLKTVRPFVMKEIALQDDPAMKKAAKKEDNRTAVTNHLIAIVDDLIAQAKEEWLEIQEPVEDEDEGAMEVPLPLVRLRVEITAPDGGSYGCENPQRFSNRFTGKVANSNDVVQFHRSKKNLNTLKKAKADDDATAEAMSHLQQLDTVKIEKLVREFLAAQSLTILPQNTFGDAVSQFVDKDDKHAVESFVNESLASQIKHLMNLNKAHDAEEDDEEGDEEADLAERMEQFRTQLEQMFDKGQVKRPKTKNRRYKPKPDTWDSDFDGHWEDTPGSLLRDDLDNGNGQEIDEDEDVDGASPMPRATATRGRGRGKGRGAATTTTSTRKPPAKKSTTAATRGGAGARGKKRAATSDDDEDEEAFSDVQMRDQPNGDDDSDPDALFVTEKPTKATGATRGRGRVASEDSLASATPAPPVRKPPPRRAAAASSKNAQSTLNFGASQASVLGVGSQSLGGSGTQRSVANDNIDDSEDDFEPVTTQPRRSRR